MQMQAKMHQIRFPLGLRPQTPLGSLQPSPRPQAVSKGPTSKGRGGEEGRKEKGREREGEVRVREERVGPQLGSLDPPVSPVEHRRIKDLLAITASAA